jgi:hypothetical protein
MILLKISSRLFLPRQERRIRISFLLFLKKSLLYFHLITNLINLQLYLIKFCFFHLFGFFFIVVIFLLRNLSAHVLVLALQIINFFIENLFFNIEYVLCVRLLVKLSLYVFDLLLSCFFEILVVFVDLLKFLFQNIDFMILLLILILLFFYIISHDLFLLF